MSNLHQRDLVARLKSIQVCGVRERHLHRSVNTFLTVSVDGEQQVQTKIIPDSLSPTWVFSEPHELLVHPSSSVKFTLYMVKRSRALFGDRYLGDVEEHISTFVTNPGREYYLNTGSYDDQWQSPKVYIDMELEPLNPHEQLLDHAEARLHRAHLKSARTMADPTEEVLMSLVHAMGSLDQLVNTVDGLVDIHPICKAAWMLISSVYKALKSQHAQDNSVKELAGELRKTLSYARRCQDLESKSDLQRIARDLARLGAEGASLMDEWMRYPMMVRTARAVTTGTLKGRTEDCNRQLKKLSKELNTTLLLGIQEDVVAILQMSPRNSQADCLCTSSLRPGTPPPRMPDLYPPLHDTQPPIYLHTLTSSPEPVCQPLPHVPHHAAPPYPTCRDPSHDILLPMPPYADRSDAYYNTYLPTRTASPEPIPPRSPPPTAPLNIRKSAAATKRNVAVPVGVPSCCSPPPLGPPPPLRRRPECEGEQLSSYTSSPRMRMPSPTSSSSGTSCWSMEADQRTLSSQSSLLSLSDEHQHVKLGEAEFAPQTALHDDPGAMETAQNEEPKLLHRRVKSTFGLNEQAQRRQVAYEMLWGPAPPKRCCAHEC